MKILLAVDESPCSEAAVRSLATYVRPAFTEVHVVHAVEWPDDLPPYLTFAEGSVAVGDVMARHEALDRHARALVERVAGTLRPLGFKVTTSVVNGHAEGAILQAAREWKPDLIVLGSHGRRGIDRLLLGSVAEGVMRHATCSVEIVRSAPSARSNAA
jgi:nucleotide-binding universal stress UspA family protein